MKRCTEQYTLQLYCTSLIYVHSKSKVTENIFNFQEWYQNTKTFISHKTFTIGKKKLNPIKNDQIWLVVAWHRFFIWRPPFQDNHFWVVPRVVVLYRFDCSVFCSYPAHFNLCSKFDQILIHIFPIFLPSFLVKK